MDILLLRKMYTSLVIVKVGIRDLRAHLSSWLDRVQAGDEVLVTERGRPIARIVGFERKRKLEELIERGIVTPPRSPKTPAGKPKHPPLIGDKTLADIVIEQRRSRPY